MIIWIRLCRFYCRFFGEVWRKVTFYHIPPSYNGAIVQTAQSLTITPRHKV